MPAVRKRLTYANVIATLALGGGAVWAAGKIGTKNLRASSVTAGKIKRNAVTNAKIRPNAVTAAKIKDGSVGIAKLAAGTNLVGTAGGGPVPANRPEATTVPLSGTVTFTPVAGVASFLSVEAKGENLARVEEKNCEPQIVPFVNGSQWEVAEGALKLRALTPDADHPTGLVPIAAATGPVGLTSPGVAQTVSVKLFGDVDCPSAASVSVAIAITQAK